MAGIGFRLQRLVDHGSYTFSLRGFLFATFLVAGPWITTIAVISIFSNFTHLGGLDYDIFRTSIIYFYAFSLILTGLYQMPLTRYLADELFAERLESLVSSYLGMIVFVSITQGVFAAIYASFIPLSLLYKTLFVTGSVTVALLWLAGIFLSCLRDFEYIGWIYIFGGLISLAAGIHLEPYFGMEGTLAGFITGQLLTWLGISWRICVELGEGKMQTSFECLNSLKNYKLHLITGLSYNLAIWLDKFIFWFSDIGSEAVKGLHYFQNYDVPIFLAYVFVIPGLGIFLTRVETDFYRTYRAFYGAILEKKPLKMIIAKYKDIKSTIDLTTWELIRIQGAIAAIIYIFAPELLRLIHYSTDFTSVLRWGILAAFFQVLFLVYSLLLLYFEFRCEATACNLMFLFINVIFTYLTVAYRMEWAYGAGYFLSTCIAALSARFILYHRLKKLIFYTFMTQKMPGEINSSLLELDMQVRGNTLFKEE